MRIDLGRRPLSFLPLLLTLLTGCGATPSSPTSGGGGNNPTTGNLTGNYLILGTLPPGAGTLSASVTFLTNSSGQINAGMSVSFPCGTGLFGDDGTAVTGTVASNGTFSWTDGSAAILSTTISLTGTAPSSAGGSFSGTYSMTPPASCTTTPYTGSFTATPIAQLTGVFTGSVPVSGNGASGSIPFTFNFTQGGTITSPQSTAMVDTVLSAAFTSQDPCLTSGKTDGTTNFVQASGAIVAGDYVQGILTANDGGLYEFSGNIANVGDTSLNLTILTRSMGTCGRSINGLVTLSRQ